MPLCMKGTAESGDKLSRKAHDPRKLVETGTVPENQARGTDCAFSLRVL
jgi:hypothetical protein